MVSHVDPVSRFGFGSRALSLTIMLGSPALSLLNASVSTLFRDYALNQALRSSEARRGAQRPVVFRQLLLHLCQRAEHERPIVIPEVRKKATTGREGCDIAGPSGKHRR